MLQKAKKYAKGRFRYYKFTMKMSSKDAYNKASSDISERFRHMHFSDRDIKKISAAMR